MFANTQPIQPQSPSSVGDYEDSLDGVRRHIEANYHSPLVVLSKQKIIRKLRRFQQAMPRVEPQFAVKANPDPQVLKTLQQAGSGFEVASRAELQSLLSLGVAAETVFYSNPIKARDHIAFAAAAGLQYYAIDSVEEMEKILSIKADASLYLRLHTTNTGSAWPLAGKFGADDSQIDAIAQAARSCGADLCGVTFHVGSQCLNAENWRNGIRYSHTIFQRMQKLGLTPRLLNLGGGFPVQLGVPVPSIEAIAELINCELSALDPSIRVIAEPGRYLVSDAGYFLCRVIGIGRRRQDGEMRRWAYLDAGYYGGLMELNEDFNYRIFCQRRGRQVSWTLAGPTCDSIDVCSRRQQLPEDLQEGDLLWIEHAGAYSNACASSFNGFPTPKVLLL